MDIDAKRLSYIETACRKIADKMESKATITSTLDRKEALKDADGVVITILSGGVDIWRNDIEIPKKYGVDINVGDTRGPSGIFRTLRTLPVMLDICKDMKELCPEAVLLNYTNPMAMLCRGMQGMYPELKITVLCHSVQGTASMLAKWIGAEMSDITYTCAGINHQAFYLDYKWKGKDAYPLLREAVKKEEIYNQEIVRNEMFMHLDYYVTESSGHNSEYNAWFRKRSDLIEKYCTNGTGWNPGVYAYILNYYLERDHNWEEDIKKWLLKDDIDISRGHEYAASIFNAIFGDNTMYTFNGNVRNNIIIDNLPEGCCVEVPVLASKNGLQPIKVGRLPDHLAVMVNNSAMCEELAVAGAIEGDKRKVFHAICYDPLTSAVLSLAEIKEMTDEMFLANKDYLPQFKF